MKPADHISRRCSLSKLIESLWSEGPLWLLEASHTWPVNELINCETLPKFCWKEERGRYWILGGRRTVRKVWNNCIKCRRFKSRSLVAEPSSLPADRIKDASVFEVIGVDLAGPLYLKRDNMLTKNQMIKFIDFFEMWFLLESVARVAAIVGDHLCHTPRH
ncbi:integrase catalytic domain-containing protein [Trichonephila clavipes]|nr:integrase catalytic domain-containing protein [Trichonephila clavipes]